jgi:hypothetical protein
MTINRYTLKTSSLLFGATRILRGAPLPNPGLGREPLSGFRGRFKRTDLNLADEKDSSCGGH